MKTYSWKFCKLKGYFWKRPRKQKKGKLQFINNRLNPRLWGFQDKGFISPCHENEWHKKWHNVYT